MNSSDMDRLYAEYLQSLERPDLLAAHREARKPPINRTGTNAHEDDAMTEATAHTTSDDEAAVAALELLNREYVASVEAADPGWFNLHLAADFRNSNPDGSLVDREGFLAQVARGAGVSGIEADDVEIRVMGEFAIVHARTRYTTPSGATGHGRYTDVWMRKAGEWLCVAAHVSRC